MAGRIMFVQELYEIADHLFDVLDKALSLYAGDSVVIDEEIRERINDETVAIRGFDFTPIAPDPLGEGFSIGQLLGVSPEESLEAVTRFDMAYEEFKHSIEVRETEVGAIETMAAAGQREADALNERIQKVQRIMPNVSDYLRELPYWWADALDLQHVMNERGAAFEGKLHPARTELDAAKRRLSELNEFVLNVAEWGTRIEDLLRTEEQRRRYDEIYNELVERTGGAGSDALRRQLAGLLAVMTASNDEVRARADRLRDEAARRQESNVGPGLLDFMDALLNLGSLVEENPTAGTSRPENRIEFKFEHREYHYYFKSKPQNRPPP